MDLQIRGKTAIMAGGSAGMGRATAERLAEAGVELYITARREERLRNAAKEFTASVSREIAQFGVNINNILPGMFATEGAEEITPIYADAFGLEMDLEVIAKHFMEHNKIPAGFLAEPDDMAPMAAILCSPLSRFIVGQNIVIDGGQHHSLF